MRKFLWIAVMGLAMVPTPAAGRATGNPRVQDHGLSLADLRGNFAGKSIGFTTACTNIGGCRATSPTLEQRNFAALAQAAVDEAGNFCATATSAHAAVAGSASAASVLERVITGSITSFDPTTQEGDVSFSIFQGGSCNGATFDSSGAILKTNGTGHVVVSDSGNRINTIVTSYISTAGIIGSVVNTTTLHRQRRHEDHRGGER